MNAFARSNLAVAALRLTEARNKAQVLVLRAPDDHEGVSRLMAIDWSLREALRLIDAATAIDDMESADSVPAPDSNARRIGT
jgi:hypothetical protein